MKPEQPASVSPSFVSASEIYQRFGIWGLLLKELNRISREPDPDRDGEFLYSVADATKFMIGRVFLTSEPGDVYTDPTGRQWIRISKLSEEPYRGRWGTSTGPVSSWTCWGCKALGGEKPPRLTIGVCLGGSTRWKSRDYVAIDFLDRAKAARHPAAV